MSAQTSSSPVGRSRWKRLLWQLLLFALMWGNIELYCKSHLLSEGLESAAGMGRLDPDTGNWLLGKTANDNAEGLHNPPVNPERPANELRIMCLGGSVTMGYGVGPFDNYPRQLELILQAQAPRGLRINVINSGIAGYGSAQCLALLSRLGPRYKPQIVTAMCGYNELNSYLYPRQELQGQSWAQKNVVGSMRSVLYLSPAYRYLWRKCLLPQVTEKQLANMTFMDVSVENLRTMSLYVAGHDAKMLLIYEAQKMMETAGPNIPIGRVDRLHLLEGYRKLAADERIPFLDMDDLLLRSSGHTEDEMLLDTCHLTVAANRLCAEKMAAKLWELGWVPRKTSP